MIKVDFKKPTPSVAFDDWLKRCDAKAKSMTGAGDVSETLYKEQRRVYLELFHGKCAYCEAKIVLDQHGGDVEHYRPKGRVTDENDNLIEIDDGQGGKQPHPGYYWLAYDWRNLLPSCIACNRPNKSGHQRVGKWNRFPVIGRHALTQAEIAHEKPLLLNPLVADDDPAQHLELDHETGRIIGKTDRGRMTEKILNLNREGLPEARRLQYDSVLARAPQALVLDIDRVSTKKNRHLQFILQFKRGQAAYSMAGRLALLDYLTFVRAQEQHLTGC
jgi:hypothetical protein